MDLNEVRIIGNVTQDIELKQTPSWNNVTSFSVATNRSWTDWEWNKQEKAEFHNIVLWGKLAEIAWEYVKKWMKVYIGWRLETRSWEAQDWSKRYKTEIVWENLIMLNWKSDWTVKREDTNDYSKKATPKKSEDDISIEDIPF